jgi:3-oxoacid CoA-transferase subunit B
VARDGTPKFKPQCELPLTGMAVVDMLITDLAVFRRSDRRALFELSELAPGVSEADVHERTSAQFR